MTAPHPDGRGLSRRSWLTATLGMVGVGVARTLAGPGFAAGIERHPSYGVPEVSALTFDVFGTVVDWRSSIVLLVNMARNRGLPWDAVLSAELAGHYKPAPQAYEIAARLLDLPAERIMMVACHGAT